MNSPPPPTPQLPARRRARGLAVAVVLLLAAVAIGVGLRRWISNPTPARPDPPDPRLDYAGPFRNVRPDVEYVGDAACRGCHGDIARTYARHPMGRSLAPIRDALAQAPTDGHNVR